MRGEYFEERSVTEIVKSIAGSWKTSKETILDVLKEHPSHPELARLTEKELRRVQEKIVEDLINSRAFGILAHIVDDKNYTHLHKKISDLLTREHIQGFVDYAGQGYESAQKLVLAMLKNDAFSKHRKDILSFLVKKLHFTDDYHVERMLTEIISNKDLRESHKILANLIDDRIIRSSVEKTYNGFLLTMLKNDAFANHHEKIVRAFLDRIKEGKADWKIYGIVSEFLKDKKASEILARTITPEHIRAMIYEAHKGFPDPLYLLIEMAKNEQLREHHDHILKGILSIALAKDPALHTKYVFDAQDFVENIIENPAFSKYHEEIFKQLAHEVAEGSDFAHYLLRRVLRNDKHHDYHGEILSIVIDNAFEGSAYAQRFIFDLLADANFAHHHDKLLYLIRRKAEKIKRASQESPTQP